MITLKNAINELQNQCCVPNSVFLTLPYQARALGIEALKFIKGLHDTEAMPTNALLPGETKE